MNSFIPLNDSEKDYKFAWSKARCIREWPDEVLELIDKIPDDMYFIGNIGSLYDQGDIKFEIMEPMLQGPFDEIASTKVKLLPIYNRYGRRINPMYGGSYVKKHSKLDIYILGNYSPMCYSDFFASKEIIDQIVINKSKLNTHKEYLSIDPIPNPTVIDYISILDLVSRRWRGDLHVHIESTDKIHSCFKIGDEIYIK